MILIDRYISLRFLIYFVMGLVTLVTFFVVVDSMTTLVKYEISSSVIFRYYLYQIPQILHQLVPVAGLMATVFTLSSMNKANELIALFSSGMSLARITMPIMVLIATISALSFLMADRVLPFLAKKKNYIYYVEIEKKPHLYSTVKTNKIWYRTKNSIFNISVLDSQKQQAQGFSLYHFDDNWDLLEMLTAKKVVFLDSSWELRNGSVTLFTKETSFPLTQVFDTKNIVMGEDVKDLENSAQDIEVMTMSELRGFIAKNKESGLDTMGYEVDYHAKFGFALAAFVMSFLGIPFSVSHHRSGGVVRSIGICIFLAFLYWSFYSSSITLGRFGYIEPVLSAWIPNILMLGITFLILLRQKK